MRNQLSSYAAVNGACEYCRQGSVAVVLVRLYTISVSIAGKRLER